MIDRPSLARYAWLSIAAAVFTMAVKAAAYALTRSVGLLSDAIESGVNLVAAVTALAAIRAGARPPDEEHAFGHDKVEYLSSGAEGALIFVASVFITASAIQRLIVPQPLGRLDLGLALSLSASLVNYTVARILIRQGKQHRSIALEADGKHLMTDVWTSVGVLLGVGAVALTGWGILDPLIALAVAVQIAWTGWSLVRRSALGLIDSALSPDDLDKVHGILQKLEQSGLHYHALRTRQAGARCFISLHLQVPGEWSVQRGHDLLEIIEQEIRQAIPTATVFTHIEPLEDPRSWVDQDLDRPYKE
jgi:cation diffusion facilitator family transporter